MKEIEIVSEDEEPLGQEDQKNIDEEMRKKQQKKKYKRQTITDEVLSKSEPFMSSSYFDNQQIGNILEKFEKFKDKFQSLIFFKYLPQNELNNVYAALQTEQFEEGDTIFEQGNDADKIYFIDKGEITCWKAKRPEDPPTYIKSYKEGESFGELALMYNYIRNYTIKAKTNVTLLSLDRNLIKVSLKEI